MKRSLRFRLLVLPLFLLSAPWSADSRELWVLNGGDRSISVIDTVTEVVVATVPLPAGNPASPCGLAFSTFDGFDGTTAFVAQGSVIHRVDVATRAFSPSIDLTALLGLPTEIVDLSPAQNRAFLTGLVPGQTSIEAYLYVAADVDSGQGSEPYFVVLDQQVLLGIAGAGNMPVVASGPLVSQAIPPADRGEALGVSVLGAPFGPAFQRAWFTTRAGMGLDLIRTIELTKGELLTSSWSTGRVVEESIGSPVPAPKSLNVATPHDRELQVLPTGTAGRLINVETGGECDLGDLGVDLRSVAIDGPGPGGYQMFAVDAANEELLRVNPATCETEAFPVGTNPTVVVTDRISQWGKAYVANTGSDDVSIVHADGTVVELAVGSEPKDLEVNRCCRGCTVKSLAVTTQLPNDDRLDWTRVGCAGCRVGVFCQCQSKGDPLCPCYCDPDTAPAFGIGACFFSLPEGGVIVGELKVLGGKDSETPWIFLGQTFSTSFVHTGAADDGLNYAISPLVP